jgi:hypothetical protein
MKFIAIIEVIIYYAKMNINKKLLFYFSNNIFLKKLNDCKVKVIYASSPQAKGKIERPYRWI